MESKLKSSILLEYMPIKHIIDKTIYIFKANYKLTPTEITAIEKSIKTLSISDLKKLIYNNGARVDFLSTN